MKISTKGRYGLRLMTDLAVYHDQGLIPLKEIAARQEISEKYLEQIMMQLNRSGLVRSVRGAQGGYMLAKTPEDITVGAAKESRGHRAAAGIAGADADNEGTGTHSHSSV